MWWSRGGRGRGCMREGALFPRVSQPRRAGRQANLTDVRKLVVADASATESGMIKCIIDPPHEILV